MIEVEIKSNELKMIICNKLNKDRNSPIYDDELKNIKDISINKYNLLNKETDINLSELIFFPNLEVCVISNSEIKDKDINVLNKLIQLKTIQFSNCIFEDIDTKLELNLNYLIVESCKKIDLNIFSKIKSLEQLRIINYKNLDVENIEEFNSIKKLYLQNCSITNISKIVNLSQLEYINLEKSIVDNSKILQILKEKLKIEYKL